MNKYWGIALALLGALQLAACETTHTADNSNTSWLCKRDDDCEAHGTELVCARGTCVMPGLPLTDAGAPLPAAGSGAGQRDAGLPDRDAGAPDRDAGAAFDAGASDPCPNGMIVNAISGCLQDDAFCVELPDGRYCTGVATPACPAGASPIAQDAPCPANATCFQFSESLRCIRVSPLSMDECHAIHGAALSAATYPDLLRDGCPEGRANLGMITDWNVGGLCCELRPIDCTPQDAVAVGSCEPASRYAWVGWGCVPITGCSCEGQDCEATFWSQELCEAEFLACRDITTPCGGLSGSSCTDSEYCAYVAGGGACGVLDAPAICIPRPEGCREILAPVCGCDGQTYPNLCAANTAGMGISGHGECN